MKLPAGLAGFDKEKLLSLLLRHGDKAVLAVVAVLACGLAWGGIDALRSKSVTAARRPDAITQAAAQAENHLNQLQKPPESIRVKPEPLAKRVQPWQSPELKPATSAPLFDSPLFEELAKRTKPDVLPVEQLQATAGLAVIAVRDQPANPAAAGPAAAPPAGNDRDPADAGGTGRQRRGGRRGGRPGELNPAEPFGGPPGPPGSQQPGFGPAGFGPPPAPDFKVARGRIVPFVVVTGLVPFDKQIEEYRRRFAETSYPDESRDLPFWSEYLVERMEVVEGRPEKWQRMDLKLLEKKAREEWAGVQPEALPPEIFMPAGGRATRGGQAQPSMPSFSSYCLPLPRLLQGSWGPETIHPEFVEAVKMAWEKRSMQGQPSSGNPQLDLPTDQPAVSPDFASPDGAFPDGSAGPGAGPGGAVPPGMEPVEGHAYRLFRFVDTSVEVGRKYRYRVRLSVWNPNWKLPAQHLQDPKVAESDRLASAPSEPSAAVRVPESRSVLARSLTKSDMKKFKAGMLEVLVLGESKATGGYALRSAITEVGGLANVDSKLNKPGDTRARGEDLQTGAVIVDARGRQQDGRDERAGAKSSLPTEPFELLVLDSSGSFAVASVADSQERIEENISTLPPIDPLATPGLPGLPGVPPPPGAGPPPRGQPGAASPF